MNRRLAAGILTAAVITSLGACGNGSTPTETQGGTTPAAVTTSSAAPSSAATATATDTVPEVSVPAPAPGTPAAVAWEALLSTSGEYMAQAKYDAILKKFGDVEPYATIRNAEQQHITALSRQLERFGAKVPGNPYTGKVEAPADLKASAQLGIDTELANIAMYDRLLPQTTDPGLTRVLTNLRRASQDAHLVMFKAALEKGGTLTKPQMLDMGFGGEH